MWGERPARGELDSSEEGEEEQEGERGGGRGAWGGVGGGGRDRLKLSQGDDVDENVPLRKGAPKRSWRRDLESTKGFVLEADLQAGSRGGGVGEGTHPDRGKTPGREGKRDSLHK